MGVQGINPQNQPPTLLPTENIGQGLYAVNKTKPFDSFERARTQPSLEITLGSRIRQMVFHPFQTLNMTRRVLKGSQASGEGFFGRIKMFREIRSELSRKGRRQLDALLKSGVLTDTRSENGHSTLYQLYSILKTQRASGLKNNKILNEVVELLNKPYAITQKFAKLSEKSAQQILQVRNNPEGLNRTGVLPVVQPLSWSDINVKNSATCVSSSVMFYMADKNPSELARQLNELTSPMLAFYEKAKLSEISPNAPEQAFEILDAAKIKYMASDNPDEVIVKVELPPAGHIRTANASNRRRKGEARTGVEAAYQSALSFMATRRSYDPSTDFRDSEVPGQMSKGLTEQEKTLMETIIKDNGGVMSVTYQLAAGKSEPKPNEEGLPFLYGYTRAFERTTADIIDALKMGEFVIIGITDTDQNGAIVGGHEITITSAFLDKKDGEVKFMVADSDDRIPVPVVRSARELVPRIHHAGMPLKIAQRIQSDIEKNPGYFVPTAEDQTFYNPIERTFDTLPPDAFGIPPEMQEQAPAETVIEAESLTPTTIAPIQEAQPKNQVNPETVVNQSQAPVQKGAYPNDSYIEYVPIYNMPPYYPRPAQQIPQSYYPQAPAYNLSAPNLAMPAQPFYYPPGYYY